MGKHAFPSREESEMETPELPVAPLTCRAYGTLLSTCRVGLPTSMTQSRNSLTDMPRGLSPR